MRKEIFDRDNVVVQGREKQVGGLPEGWREVTLADIADIIPGFAFKGEHFSDDGEEKVIKIKDIQEPFIDLENATKILIKNYSEKKLQKFLISKGDFAIAMTGATIGKIGKFIDSQAAYINQRVAKFDAKKNSDKKFIYYTVRNPEFKNFVLNNIDSQSAQGNISSSSLGKYKFFCPPLPEQKAIAAILGALDDKIEANRKMNATLDGIARALFKSWFVDFDPVRAKAEGRPSGLPAALDALFPASFTDSPLGEIPAGWEVLSIGELGKVITGKTPSTSNTENFGSEYPFVTIPDLDGRMFINFTARYLSKQGAKAIQSSLIPENAVMMSCIATVGRCGITVEKSFTNQQINTLVCNQSKAMPSFMYWMFRNITNEVFNSGGGGSVYTNVSKSRFSNIKVICPSVKIQEIFCQAWFEKLKKNDLQNKTLATLRDTLLPKLISGQIRVGDVEKLVEGAA